MIRKRNIRMKMIMNTDLMNITRKVKGNLPIALTMEMQKRKVFLYLSINTEVEIRELKTIVKTPNRVQKMIQLLQVLKQMRKKYWLRKIKWLLLHVIRPLIYQP